MSAIIDITKIIELKKVLEEKFESKLHIHDTCGGQYFEVKSLNPASEAFIKQYFAEKNYQVIFDNDNEFHLEDMRRC